MASNPYDFSFVLKKQLQKKILNIFLVCLFIFILINLILHWIIFPVKVGKSAMNPEFSDNSLVFVAPCNFEKPLFFQKYDIARGNVVYFDAEEVNQVSLFKSGLKNFTDFFTARKISVFETENTITEKPTLRRVVGLPGDTLYIKDYVAYVKPKGSLHFLTEYELTDKMYETIIQINESINPLIGVPRDMEQITLGENEYFLLADNRVSSVDSRLYGPVNVSEIKGKAILRFYPFSSFDALL